MQKAHDSTKNDYWKNKPNITTPIIAEQLNRMELTMDTIDNRVVGFDTTKADQVDLLTCVASITLNTTSGIMTITLKNGTSTTIDTGLAKLAVNFDYDDDPESAHYQQLVLELKDGTYKYIDLSALLTQYEFTNTSTISFTVGADGSISANVVNGSITAEKLQPNYLADVTAQANAASQSANASSGSALVSEGFAKGTQNGQAVTSESPYYHNNAEYFKDQAQSIVGDKVDSFNGRTGIVVPANGDYSDTQVSRGQGTVGDTLDDLEAYNTFSIAAASWQANTDNSTNMDYPYIYNVSSALFTAASTPIWQMNGVGIIPTATERDSIDMILEAVFGVSGVTLYATALPTVNLILQVKGV